MRYPGEADKSDSINNTSCGDNTNSQLFGAFSPSSSTSASSQEQDSTNDAGGRNVATISEHVLFGNNNGQNSFLYLYYSESSTRNSNNSNRRPNTTGGGGGIETLKTSSNNKMGSTGQHPWNDLSGGYKRSGGVSGRGSAGPSPISYGMNDGDEFEFDERKGMKGTTTRTTSMVGSKSTAKTADLTPYPVYLSPVEGSPVLMPSSPERSSSKEVRGEDVPRGRSNRLDSLTAGILDEDDDDDWDRIYSVPEVGSRYVFSPPESKPIMEAGGGSSGGSRKLPESTRIKKSSSNNLTVRNNTSTLSSASSSKNLKAQQDTTTSQGHHSRAGSRRVRITPETSAKGRSLERPSGMKKWSSTTSMHSNKMLRSPVPSSTPSNRSLKKQGPQQNPHGVTHHHHQPPNGNGGSGGGEGHGSQHLGKRVSCATSGDGIDHMSLKNGIGAFFGTQASKRMSQIHEPTPEEMYREEMQGLRSRLTLGATIFAATLFILSCSSLLFVFPILVDPILVGFEAKFSDEPVTCRTTNFRNGSGPSECAIPSCREGCTLDLFSCMFVEVEYSIADDDAVPHIHQNPIPAKKSDNNDSVLNTTLTFNNDSFLPSSPSSTTTTSSSLLSPSHLEDGRSRRSAILLINVNGCGYPPDVTCSDFERKYAPLHTEFPCYYSKQNESIVVPHYSRHTEIIHLTLAVCIPVGLAITSGISLCFLIKYNAALKRKIYKKYAARKRALRAKNMEKRKKLDDEAEEEREREREREREKSDENEEEDVTSISELEDYEAIKVEKPVQNGNLRTRGDNSELMTSTQM